MKNRNKIEINPDIKILLTLFCFQEEIYQKNFLKNYETPRNSKDKDNSVYIIEKSVMEKYKIFYNYEILYKFLKSKKNILDCIKENNLIDTEKLKSRKILNEIFSQLPDDFINKINNIDKINKNKLIEEIENENKKEWNYKMIKYENNKLCLKFIDEFEIISNELYIYLEGQGLKLSKFLLGNYIIGNQKIFINLKGSGKIFYEIGKIERDGNFIIEYLFNPEEINNSTLFYKNLKKFGLKLGVNSKEINDISIYEKQYKFYKVNKNKIEEFTEEKIVSNPNNNTNNDSIRNRYLNKKIAQNNSNNNKNIDNNTNKKNEKKIVSNDSNNNSKKVDINNINKTNNTSQLNINETLSNIISLYLYYKKIKMKKNINFEEYYLINKDYINEIIIDIGYKKIYDELNEKLSENVNDKTKINDCYNLLDQNILKEYSNKKFNKIIIKNDYEIEPTLNSLNYYDYLEGEQNDSLMIYNNFEIIDKNTLSLFIQNITEYIKNLTKCIFNNGKIIINMPNNNINNNKIVSLIGILESYYNYFIVEYILVYNNEVNRNKHIQEIISNLDGYLNNFKFSNNNSEIILNNSEIIGTIIKYDNDNNTSYINNDNNNNIIIINNNLKDKFKSCPKIGLQNIGATCYMNSTLQCFSHITEFVEFFKYNPQINDIVTKNKNNDKNLSVSFKTLIDNLWPDNLNQSTQKYYSPDDFKNKISKMNPLFEGIQANDAKDLVNFIIMTLHLELNKDRKNSESTEKQNVHSLSGGEYESFKKDILEKNNSIISELFYAINSNITMCSECNKYIQNYQIYFFINFPLEEVRLYKMNNMNNVNNMNNMNNINYNQNNNNNFIGRSMSVNVNNIRGQYMMVPQNQFNMNMNAMYYQQGMYNNFAMNPQTQINNYPNNYIMNQQSQFNNNGMIAPQIQPNNTINEVSIIDCFEYDRKENRMGGENSFFCNNCGGLKEAIMKTNLMTGPEVLIIILNRGKGIEFDVKINFTEVLDLSNYIEKKDTGCRYQLIGVITHLGESSMSGHFIAYCRDPINKTSWYKYNDAIVSDVSDFKKEVIDFAMPYLLFYQKDKTQ